jgi:uncharacterized protein YjgD (DUF1641 family)
MKKLNKQEILQIIKEQFSNEFVDQFKNYKLNDLQKEFKITHTDIETGNIFYKQEVV